MYVNVIQNNIIIPYLYGTIMMMMVIRYFFTVFFYRLSKNNIKLHNTQFHLNLSLSLVLSLTYSLSISTKRRVPNLHPPLLVFFVLSWCIRIIIICQYIDSLCVPSKKEKGNFVLSFWNEKRGGIIIMVVIFNFFIC